MEILTIPAWDKLSSKEIPDFKFNEFNFSCRESFDFKSAVVFEELLEISSEEEEISSELDETFSDELDSTFSEELEISAFEEELTISFCKTVIVPDLDAF